jgi:hypothetical protein
MVEEAPDIDIYEVDYELRKNLSPEELTCIFHFFSLVWLSFF